MTNLPITTSAPQATAPSQQAANNNESGDAQSSQPFGEVLAKQVNGAAAKDVKDAKANDKNAVDMIAQLVADAAGSKKDTVDIKKDAVAIKTDTADTKKPDVAAKEGPTTLPADMLAAMLTQAMNNSGSKAQASAKSDSPAINTSTALDKRGVATLPASAAATAQTTPAAKAATETNLGAQVEAQSFAAAREAVSTTASEQQSNAAALATLQNTAANANVAAPVVLPVQVTVNTPVNQTKWGDEFSQKITWLASSKQDQTAELHLNPPQLGPVDVVLKVSGDQATALFTSPHAAVREAIEQAMPKLRDMLADNGIMLGNTTVSDQAPRDQGQSNTPRSPAATDNDIRDAAIPGNSTVRVSQISRHNGIVDTFA